MKFTIFVTVVLGAFMVVGCSKKSAAPTEPTVSAPSIPEYTFTGPTTSSNDPYAAEVKALTQSANVYTAYFATFGSQVGTQNGNTWTWTYSAPNWSITFTGTKNSDGSYTWKWVENGTDPQTQTTYNNWTLLEGTSGADGKTGEWKIYQDNTTTLSATYSWSVDANGTAMATLTDYMDDGTTVNSKIVITNNSDKSGEVDSYDGTTLTFKATWTSSGTGQWWEYDTDGTSLGNGSWT